MKKIVIQLTLLILISNLLLAQKLIEAVEAKDHAAAEQYIKDGEKVNKTDKAGQFPLWKAVWNNDTTMVALLIKNGADVNQKLKGKEAKTACIEIAAQEGHLEIAKLMVDAGADFNGKNFRGHTPLRIASRNGHLELVKYFISKGSEIDSRGDDGATPLEHASAKGHLEVVRFLVENGANVNIQDKEKDFPLSEAAKFGFVDVVNYLLSKGADINLKNQNGHTAEEIARISGQVKIAEILKRKAGN